MQMITTQKKKGGGKSPLGSCEGAHIMNAWGEILENTQKDRNKAVRV